MMQNQLRCRVPLASTARATYSSTSKPSELLWDHVWSVDELLGNAETLYLNSTETAVGLSHSSKFCIIPTPRPN